MPSGRHLDINVTGNYLLADEAAKLFAEQGLDATIVLTSSANAAVAKRGSEAYDVSKAALSHLVRELAVRPLAPGFASMPSRRPPSSRAPRCSPATGVRASLAKYNIPFEESLSDEELRTLLARLLRQRTLTHQPIEPGRLRRSHPLPRRPRSRCTSGHLIPVDGGLPEAFLR